MFAPPPVLQAAPFARLPQEMRVQGRESAWLTQQPGSHAAHSLLEGPALDAQGTLHCVDVLWGRIFRITPSGEFTLLKGYDGEPNGLKFHPDGRLLIADYRHGVLAMDPETLHITPLIERVRLERLKAVNDLTLGPNGDLYFTDQGLTGLHDPSGRVFRLRANGSIDCLLDNVPSPNGLVLDPSGEILYVAATRANAVWRVPLMRDGSVAKVGTYIQLSGGGGPDGLAMDVDGRLVVAHVGLGAVWVFSPRGEPELRIVVPGGAKTTNVAFGGADRRILYITEADEGAVHTAVMPAPGLLR